MQKSIASVESIDGGRFYLGRTYEYFSQRKRLIMYWDLLTTTEIAQKDKNIPVILPISATEQHGPHLPLATDRMIGEYFCRLLDERISNQVLILPMQAIGCSDHHLDFSGSLSIQHQHFLNSLTDILNSVKKHGFQNLIVFNSHGGNQGIGQVLIESFGFQNPNVNIALITWWRLAIDHLIQLNESGKGGVGHAGEFETSLMLLIAPHLVHIDKMEERKNIPSFDWSEGDLIRSSKASHYRSMSEMTANGVYGDPSLASAEKGKEIAEIIINELSQIVTTFSEQE